MSVNNLLSIIIVLLLGGCASIGFPGGKPSSLFDAAFDGNTAEVKEFISKGADVNTPYEYQGVTPLIIATMKGYQDIVVELLNAGADPDIADDPGQTALMYASFDGYADIARILLMKGANPNATNKTGWTALHGASFNGHKKIVELLIRNGADITHKDKYGMTAAMEARKTDHIEIAHLLEKRTPVNEKNETP